MNLQLPVSCLCVAGIALAALSAQAQSKNVLFIAVDDLRTSIGAYGDSLAVTPNIDRLASSGVLFEHHYVQQPSCAPSRSSMLTGLRPDEIGVVNHATHFRDVMPDVVTLPQTFKNAGYQTIGIGKIFHYGRGYYDNASWTMSVYDSNWGLTGHYVLPENKSGEKAESSECVDVLDSAYPDGRYTDLAVDLLRKFKLEKAPFFLAVGYMKPHLPFNAPKRYWDLYDRDAFYPIEHPQRPLGAPEIAFHNSNELRGYSDIPERGPIPLDKAKELRHGYYACVSYIDAQVGVLLDTLDELGLRENTIIVFWSDHGFHLGEHDYWCKSTNFELDARSPLIIAAPTTAHVGAKTPAMVQALDVYPTLLQLAGLEPAGELSGRSLLPLLKDPQAEWPYPAFNQFARPYRAAISGRQAMTHMGYSVRVRDWRFTAWLNVVSGEYEYPELYNLKDTYLETENLADRAEYREIHAQLFSKVKAYSADRRMAIRAP